MSIPLSIYLTATNLVAPLWRISLRRRARRGKEDPDRLSERLGRASKARPSGPMIWFHALGIGEAMAVLSLIEALRQERPELSFLLTTNTRTGADGLARIGLPMGVIHQYAPIDSKAAVTAFLDHWRPDAFVLAELDLWPRMLHALATRAVPMAMVNARLTDRRFKGRMRLRGLFAPLFPLFRTILLQDQISATRMVSLGAHEDQVTVAGLLKAAADPLPADETTLVALRHAIGARPVWLAAATEEREHEPVLRAHALARNAIPDLLMILAPRQLTAADSAARAIETAFGSTLSRRSLGELPGAKDAVFLADSIGEMGLWYRVAPISFVGHSLNVPGDPPLPGKNPFEAALLRSVVVHGPSTGDFAESYSALVEAGASVPIQDEADLAREVVRLHSNELECTNRNDAAEKVIASARAALPVTLEAILKLTGINARS